MHNAPFSILKINTTYFFYPQRNGTHARAKTRYDQRPRASSKKQEKKNQGKANKQQQTAQNDNTNTS